MRKLCKTLALTLCVTLLLSTLTVVGDSGGKAILTLEDAKAMALKSDTRYKQQQSYIEQKKEDFEDIVNKTIQSKGRSIVEKTQSYVAGKMAVDSAENAWKLEVFKKGDIKRQSDYNVTIAYYNVMKAKYSLDDTKRAMELAQKDLTIAKLEFDLGEKPKNYLSQIESAYKSSQTKYESALSELKNKMKALGKEIGKDLDIEKDDIDMTIRIPDITSLDLSKIKEDYLKNSPDFYSLKSALLTYEHQKYLIDEKYEEYDEKTARISDTIEDGFNELKYRANRDYDDAQYKYDEAVKALDISLNEQYSGIKTVMETIENLNKSIADMRITVKNDKLRNDLGLLAPIELSKSESALKDLENTLNTAIVNLNTQYLALTQFSYTREKQ
ncbi:MAG: TolC family protein [Clostridiaceae bacterium]|jgi:outer membrane protein TolC|nr:TolC family protein [Clostridiaceae bacterium]